MRFPLLSFLILPVLELYLLFVLADEIGGLSTLLWVITTAVIGVAVMRGQGQNGMRRVMQRVQQGESPGQELLNNMLLGFAGLMLILPGLITDSIGLLLLVPLLRQRAIRRMSAGQVSGSMFMGGFYRKPSGPGGDIIDGEIVGREQPGNNAEPRIEGQQPRRDQSPE